MTPRLPGALADSALLGPAGARGVACVSTWPYGVCEVK